MGLHSWQGAVGDGVARPSALGCALFIEEEDIMKYRKASPSERRAVAAEFLAARRRHEEVYAEWRARRAAFAKAW